MLYITTRNDSQTYTAQQVADGDRGAEGGFFVPLSFPRYTPAEISRLKEKSFHQCIAEVLNRLFPVHLSEWDVRFSIGRSPVRLQSLGHRCTIVQSWHNPQWEYEYLEKRLASSLNVNTPEPGNWVRIAIEAAVLFGIFSDLQRSGIDAMDVSMVSGDFAGPTSAWYAHQWGLPIGNILCCCNENRNVWGLICHGDFRTDGVSLPTQIPEADVVIPKNLEHLIYGCGGTEEVQHYLEACRTGMVYIPGNMVLEKMRKGLYVSVISTQRALETISNVYRAYEFVLTPHSALAYAGMMDYRTRTGIMRHAIVIEKDSPRASMKVISAAIGTTEEELNQYF